MPMPSLTVINNYLIVPSGGGGAWTPDDLAVKTARWKANEPSTIHESSTLVSQWDDFFGNGYDAVQATGANQPNTGTATVNGHNVIEFNESFRSTYLTTTLPASPATRTVIYIGQNQSSHGTGFGNWAGADAGGALTVGWNANNPPTNQAMVRAGVAVIGTSTGTAPSDALSVMIAEYVAGTSYAFWTNGSADGSGAHAITCAGGNFVIGPNRDLMCELIVSDAQLSVDDIAGVWDYAAAEWGWTP